jgi:NAD(P)-dependent dehydrogenase (short-subunit alcohol dehydrogenase family)
LRTPIAFVSKAKADSIAGLLIERPRPAGETVEHATSGNHSNRLEGMYTVRFENRTAIITGAGSGIGRAIACRFAKEGADIAIADINLKGSEETAAMVREIGRRVVVTNTDVSNAQAVRESIATVISELGYVDIVVNNAGINIRNKVYEMSDEQWHRVIDVNLHGVWYFCRGILDHFFKRGHGNIVNIASIGAVEASHDRVPYMASKGGVAAMTRALAIDLAHKNIRVNAVAPGMVASNFASSELKAELDAWVKLLSPARRWATPDEIAAAVAFLASDDSSYVNGHVLTVDGGMTAGNRIGRTMPSPEAPEQW